MSLPNTLNVSSCKPLQSLIHIQVELTNTVSAIKDISRRALQVGDIAVESNVTNSASLKLVMQRLVQEKIALTAAVQGAEASANESARKVSTMTMYKYYTYVNK